MAKQTGVVSAWNECEAEDTICLWITTPALIQKIYSLTNPFHTQELRNMILNAGLEDKNAPLRALLESLVGVTISFEEEGQTNVAVS